MIDLGEVDRLIAETVMGWHQVDIPASEYTLEAFDNWCDEAGRGVIAVSRFRPSTEWEYAGMVFEKCGGLQLEHMDEHWIASFIDNCLVERWTRQATGPIALCLAALKKHGVAIPLLPEATE